MCVPLLPVAVSWQESAAERTEDRNMVRKEVNEQGLAFIQQACKKKAVLLEPTAQHPHFHVWATQLLFFFVVVCQPTDFYSTIKMQPTWALHHKLCGLELLQLQQKAGKRLATNTIILLSNQDSMNINSSPVKAFTSTRILDECFQTAAAERRFLLRHSATIIHALHFLTATGNLTVGCCIIATCQLCVCVAWAGCLEIKAFYYRE